MSRFSAPIAEQIWDMKYRLKEADGTAVDSTVEDTWRRIAKSLASVEADPGVWEDKFLWRPGRFQISSGRSHHGGRWHGQVCDAV